ncbi:hypothetical protein Clacol_007035 [Clathrus columnatus]|uniref:Metallo-beta-lactamase domain-containing protein n=1 Tax=Clathrus columnatus TaxID=1419009 RepID=A0AAV5ALJ5_9AGAM|nr:hypothetical protein Clacol_007035 [Clathrus columnatus]
MSTSITITLPSPSNDQSYMTVSALEGGHLDLPVSHFLEGVPNDERNAVPVLAFFMIHSKTGTKIVFDSGIKKDIENLAPAARQYINDHLSVRVDQDVSESLLIGGVNPSDISHVIFSHLHWDQLRFFLPFPSTCFVDTQLLYSVGDASWFPNATFIIGGGSRKLLQDPYPQNPDSAFPSDCVPKDPGRTRFLDDPDFSETIGGFPRACDLFNDGSLYVIDAHGHLDGHINVLARTSPTGGWILLGGDTCHDHRLFEDGAKISCERNEKGEVTMYAHSDFYAAEIHLERVRRLRKMEGVDVLVAHDSVWYNIHKGGESFLPGHISPRA